MSQLVERTVHGLRVVIDREQCVGFGDCVKEAPEGFKLDDDTIAVFAQPETVERERLLRACDSCPVDAITVWDETGSQIVPGEPGGRALTGQPARSILAAVKIEP